MLILITTIICAFSLCAVSIWDHVSQRKEKHEKPQSVRIIIYVILFLGTTASSIYSRYDSLYKTRVEESLSILSPEEQKQIIEDSTAIREELVKKGCDVTKADKTVKLWYLGQLSLQKNDKDRAVNYLNLSLQTVETGVAHITKGIVVMEKDTQQAFKEFKRGVYLNQNFALGHLNYGKLLFDFNKTEEAKKEFQTAIKLNNNYSKAYANLSTIYFNQDSFKLAESLIVKAIKIEPQNYMFHRQYAFRLEEKGYFNEAKTEYELTINLNPEDYLTYNNLGLIYYKQKDYVVAENYYRKVIKIKPDDYLGLKNLAILLDEINRRKEAIVYWEKALIVEPNETNKNIIQQRLKEK